MMAVLPRTAGQAHGIMRYQEARSRSETLQQGCQTCQLLRTHASGRIPKPAVARGGIDRHQPYRTDMLSERIGGAIDAFPLLPGREKALKEPRPGHLPGVVIVVAGHCYPRQTSWPRCAEQGDRPSQLLFKAKGRCIA